MPLLILAAVAGFSCANPVHRDGASIRCGDSGPVFALEGVKAQPPGGPCFRSDDCPVDIGRLAQDHLADLTRGRPVVCMPAGRGSVRCKAASEDLSCAMIGSGLAKSNGDALGCPTVASRPAKPAPASAFAAFEPYRDWLVGFLIFLNILTFAAFLEDRRRARSGLNRVSDIHLLALSLFGGSFGGFVAQQATGHLRDDEPFASQFIVLLGLQIGGLIGLFAVPPF